MAWGARPPHLNLPPLQVFVPLGVITGVPGVTWEKFIFNNLIPGERSCSASMCPLHMLLSQMQRWLVVIARYPHSSAAVFALPKNCHQNGSGPNSQPRCPTSTSPNPQ